MWLSTYVILQLNCHHAAITSLLVEEFLNLSFKSLRFWLDCDVILCCLLLFAILSQIALNCQLDPTELWTDIRPTKVTTIQKATRNRWHMITRMLVMPWSPTTVFHGVTGRTVFSYSQYNLCILAVLWLKVFQPSGVLHLLGAPAYFSWWQAAPRARVNTFVTQREPAGQLGSFCA